LPELWPNPGTKKSTLTGSAIPRQS
jgi:hypothetical protein